MKSGLYVVEDAFIYTLLYTQEDCTTFKAIQIFLKYNLNESVKKLYNKMLLIQTKFRTLNPK